MYSFGEKIEDFQILEQLGKGGFAVVHRGICQKTFREVAIKMIDKQTMQAQQMTERVRQEVAIHSRLKHSSILELYTFFEDADYVYLVLELAHNGELNRLFKENEKVFGEFQAAAVIQQVLDGLLYLHSHNICHRDLSLSNLLVTRCMKVKICDFGLATQLSHLSEDKHRTLCGTPNYISPEVASRSAHGLPADVWGLGCTLYTLLVGCPPFDTKGIKSTLTQVCIGSFNLPEYLSTEAQDLIKRTLCKDPMKRATLQEIVEHPFLQKAKSGTNTMSFRLSFLEAKSYVSVFPPPAEANPIGCSKFQEVHKQQLSVPPLNTLRLQPTRHKTNNAILTILPSGEVVVEFVKHKMKFREDRVVNVCRISPDGLRIVLYQPGGNNGLPIGPQPPELPANGADHLFSYENLPAKHFKKYLYASRFIEMVQAKTPKVTFYSTRAKCQLMESRVDYEANFYGGEKIVKTIASAEDSWRISSANDREVQLTHHQLNQYDNLLQHAKQCLMHCLQVEELNSTVVSQFSTFPIIIGRRPILNSADPSTRIQQKENTFNNYLSAAQTPIRSPHLQMPSFSIEQVNTPSPSLNPSPFGFRDLNQVNQGSRSSGFTKKTFIPGVGYATLLTSGIIQIQYSDGTQITILSPEKGGGILYNAASSNGLNQTIHYREDDFMPDGIKMKMKQIPDVMKQLFDSHVPKNLHSSTPCSSRVGNQYLR